MAKTTATPKEDKFEKRSDKSYGGDDVQKIARELTVFPTRKERVDGVYVYFYDGIDIEKAYETKNGFDNAVGRK